MNVFTIMRKELRNYFISPVAYAFFIIFLAIVGFFFYLTLSHYSLQCMFASRTPQMLDKLDPIEGIIQPLFSLMGFLMIFFIPVLTMRLFAEEKKLGTMELLFTYPITDFQLVMGKFLASMCVMLIITAFSLIYIILYNTVFKLTGAQIPWGIFGSGYLGLLLLSLSFISFGIWVSSLTSDQVTAALATVGGLLVFWIIGSAKMEATGWMLKVVSQLSLVEHFQDFAKGVLDTHHIVYLVCFSIFFLFLTVQVLEVRKWNG